MKMSKKARLVCLVLLLCLLVPTVVFAGSSRISFTRVTAANTAVVGTANQGSQSGHATSASCPMRIQLFYCSFRAMPNPFAADTIVVRAGTTVLGSWKTDPAPWQVFWQTRARPGHSGGLISGWAAVETR